jgi:hypothetical protein
MTHETTGMAGMKNPAKGFSKVIRRIDNARDVTEFKMTLTSPVLNGKVLDVNVPRPFGRLHCVDYPDGRDIFLKQEGGLLLGETNLVEDKSQVFCNLSGRDGG